MLNYMDYTPRTLEKIRFILSAVNFNGNGFYVQRG